MSQVFDLCEGDDNGEWPNAMSVPPLPLSRKRRRDKEESFNDAHPRNHNGPGHKTATGWAELVFDLEFADEVEDVGWVSPHRKRRRRIMKGERSAKNDVAGNIAQTLKGFQSTERDVGSEDAQVVDHYESHEGIDAAASRPINLDSEQTSRDDGSANKHPESRSTTKPPPNASGWQRESLSAVAVAGGTQQVVNEEDITANTNFGRESPIGIADIKGSSACTWEDRLSELANYRKIHGHCNVPSIYSKNAKLGRWVANQKYQHSVHRKGETSSITLPRIQALESLGFEWRGRSATWEDRLSELADYCKVHGHCNVPRKYSENAELGRWVTRQRDQHSLHMKGKTSQITLPRIQELERLGFEWGSHASAATWEDRLSELADYRKVHGHCNVPGKYSENAELGRWVTRQKYQHNLHLKGKTSQITLSRIQALESLGFRWGSRDSTCTWEDRLSELADFRKVHGHCNVRKVHGHCNVPQQYSENARLATWVTHQRSQYSLHQEGETSQITLPRIQALESLGFEWGSRGATYTWEDRLSELADYCKLHGNCNVPKSYSENAKLGRWVETQRETYSLHLKGRASPITLPRIEALKSLGFEWGSRGSICPWEERLSELADYHKVHGHCNVPKKYSESAKLYGWVTHQKSQYSLHIKGETSQITLFRIQALESLGFEWGSRCTAWEDRLSELTNYRKIHGHCNVSQKYSEKSQLGRWVANQRYQHSLHLKGETSTITLPRIEALDSLGFDWRSRSATCSWEDRLSELADYRKVHGHCNVPKRYTKNAKLYAWIANQRYHNSLHQEGKTSQITLPRIEALERLGFEWKPSSSRRRGTTKKANLHMT
jgi:hypothetical protein